MTTMTRIACPANVWTPVYTAGAGDSIGLFNASPSTQVRIRIGTDAVVGDPATAPANVIQPWERSSWSGLELNDKVFAMPVGSEPGAIVLWS